MKKSIIALIILSIFCFASVVSAANPFSDVPANHWAYGAVNKLVKAGIIDGNGGAFKGEQTLTRYEVAQMVAKAIAKEEKADAENRALIEKLAKEFASELNTLGVRVAELEKNQGNQGPLKIDGWFRYAYENAAVSTSAATYFTNNSLSSDKVRNRDEIWLNIANKFDGTTRFEGSIQTETASDDATGTMHLKKAFMAYQAGQVEIAAGRFFPNIGKGTLLSAPLFDGTRISYSNPTISASAYAVYMAGQKLNYRIADLQYNFSNNLNVTMSYMADKQKNYYNDAAVGFEYKAPAGITLTGEYAANRSTLAKAASGLSNPYAYYIRAKYKGANPFAPGSTGVWVQYEKAVNGFDLMGDASPGAWATPYNWSAPSGGGYANDVKGVCFGVERTLAQRLILTTTYNPLKSFDGNTDKKLISAQVWYLF